MLKICTIKEIMHKSSDWHDQVIMELLRLNEKYQRVWILLMSVLFHSTPVHNLSRGTYNGILLIFKYFQNRNSFEMYYLWFGYLEELTTIINIDY